MINPMDVVRVPIPSHVMEIFRMSSGVNIEAKTLVVPYSLQPRTDSDWLNLLEMLDWDEMIAAGVKATRTAQ